MPKAIAVYGTLRYGGPANGLLKGFKYLGKDHIYGKIYDINGYYPALLLGTEEIPDEKVVVDLYEIKDERLLSNIDRYEGYFPNEPDQSLYNRELTLTVEGNMEVWVYTYRFDIDESLLIPSGDWFDNSRRSNKDEY